MPSKHLPSLNRDIISHLLPRLRLLFHPYGIPPSRGPRHEWCNFSRAADIPDQSQLFPPEIELSPMNDPSTPPERIVDVVHNLKPFLPSECKLLGQEDLNIIGSCPIDAGGFADVWVAVMKDGTKVAIKSHRYYSSSSCLPVYLVSNEHHRNESRSPNATDRGCTRKH